MPTPVTTTVLWVSVNGGNRLMSKKIQSLMVMDGQCASEKADCTENGLSLRRRFSCDDKDVSQRQAIQKMALLYLHTGALERTTILGDRQDLRP